MSFAGFGPSIARELEHFVERHRVAAAGRRVAVFDADGTLWRGDVGEAFFRHQVERGTIPGAPKRAPWEAYCREAFEGDAVKAYGWLAQWNAGVRESELVRWCEEYFVEYWAGSVFEPMRALTHALLNAQFEVWVVTGSLRWVVQAGVTGFGIQPDRVIGTSVAVSDGVLTEELDNIVPYRAGKARLIESIIGRAPLFAAGNTYWDKEMLGTAEELALVIHSEQKGEPNYDSEQKLVKLAPTNDWLVQRF